MSEGHSYEAAAQLDVAIEEGAARELAGSVLSATATFADGSIQTKSYLIEAPDLGNPTSYALTEITGSSTQLDSRSEVVEAQYRARSCRLPPSLEVRRTDDTRQRHASLK
ncbi:hypothetical protein B5F40_15245 [Gordonibacter sp. An230]|uniref:hypothetical protein n=1 Tax=Gordonibacter sp. An230 TaxID=1965592 RepID=UPI000B393A01|nr:hypothetical protein [Gordonibacter sp. An230]OUO86306.1 hypothetical protein B5F40_15245 [Gordonibacter sp. An230]